MNNLESFTAVPGRLFVATSAAGASGARQPTPRLQVTAGACSNDRPCSDKGSVPVRRRA